MKSRVDYRKKRTV